MKAASSASAGSIRTVQPSDYARIAELAGQLSYPSTPEEIARRLQGLLRTAEAAVFVAELETGEIAGWIAVFVYRTVEADARAELADTRNDCGRRDHSDQAHTSRRNEQDWQGASGCSSATERRKCRTPRRAAGAGSQ